MARLKRILRHPAAAVVLLVLLGLSVWSLPSGVMDGTTVGWIRSRRFNLVRGPFDRGFYPPRAYVVHERGDAGSTNLRLVDVDTESWNELSKLFSDRPGDILEGKVSGGVRRVGFYAPTRKIEYLGVSTRTLGNEPTFTEADVGSARVLLADWFIEKARDHDGYAQWRFGRAPHSGELLRTEDARFESILLTGYLHNTCAFVGLIALLYSLRWNLSPSLWRARNRAKRLSRGECPRCRYALHGLADNKCPECGEVWTSAEEQAARA